MDFRNGGLNKEDTFYKLISLQCSWARRLLANHFPTVFPPSYTIIRHSKSFCETLKFHSNLNYNNDIVSFPHILQNYASYLKELLQCISNSPLLHINSRFMI